MTRHFDNPWADSRDDFDDAHPGWSRAKAQQAKHDSLARRVTNKIAGERLGRPYGGLDDDEWFAVVEQVQSEQLASLLEKSDEELRVMAGEE